MNNKLRIDIFSPQNIPAKMEGYSFNLYDDIWLISVQKKLYVGAFLKKLDEGFKVGFLHTLSHYVQNNSPAGVITFFKTVRSFFEYAGYPKSITEKDFLAYKISCGNKQGKCFYLKSFFKTWSELGYSGVDDELYNFLTSWSNFRNALKPGDVVKRKDPQQGPLTDHELYSFNDAALRAYEKGTASLSELTICLLISHTGRRPLQITQMKVSDIIKTVNKKGDVIYLLNIPRVKQRSGFRELFRTFRITEHLYSLLCKQSEDSVELVSSLLNRRLSEDENKRVPLFVSENNITDIINNGEADAIFMSDKMHYPDTVVTALVKKIISNENVFSERTGKILNGNAKRFRYTLGTRAAREGFSEIIIGELLDHSSSHHASIYVQNNVDNAYKIDKAVNEELSQYAKFFQGEILTEISDNTPTLQKIRDRNGDNTGVCNQCLSCNANVPIPCYTCINFRPWINAPHEKIYEQLIEERKRVYERTKDERVTEALDRTILAVKEVIRKCNDIKNGKTII
ncbi:hypothetical protein B5S52_05355 [Pectobacterium brasiliense]|uniref:site-specific integrase n=1 Tax=Pectobacterium brasiliense TaxID=180957 RepID=UPI0009B048AC|nr:site-specific integrase [Pectobacterium brasiliense]ARA75342.1 hypothetical protein B5S52_05355 [Pectobacterium brasiliense]MBN3192169.1 tyrosine-type recombinase/integrase [Pectobacterium brasiliense]